jgi:hypothetical protein
MPDAWTPLPKAAYAGFSIRMLLARALLWEHSAQPILRLNES